MKYTIDEIYELLTWDMSLSADENEAKIQKGIAAASETKNLFPFLQPILSPPEKTKAVWEACARVVALCSDEALKPYLFKLLAWIADQNWPGAELIYERLCQMPSSTVALALEYSRRKAQKEQDRYWLKALDSLQQDINQKA